MTTSLRIAALCLAILAPAAFAAKPPSCSDIRLEWTFDQGYEISGDGAPYRDGTDRVAGTLYICGSKDATLNLNNSSRLVSFQWPAALVQNSETPAWAKSSAGFSSQAFFNVRKILGNNSQLPSSDYVITTTMGGNFTGPDGRTYNHRRENNTALLAGTDYHMVPAQDLSWINTPYMTSKVRVAYTAATKTWVVTPDESEVFSGPAGDAVNLLTLVYSKGRSNINGGQFSGVRFRIVIKALN